jgi:hypothetical protein
MLRSRLCGLGLVLLLSTACQATVFDIFLEGKAGAGLISGNQNTVINGTPGSGGEVGGGITYDDVTNNLSINIAWGSGNGFTDLTGTASDGHIHGPTPSNAPASYLEDVGVMIGFPSLSGWNPSATSGGFSNSTIPLTETQEGLLMNGRLYINIHTSANGGGEIRGQMLVPEPGSAMLLAGAAGLTLLRRRRA